MNYSDVAKFLGVPTQKPYLDEVEFRMARATASESSILQQPIKRLLATGGKRLRPSLLMTVAGRPDDIVVNAGAAIELLHLSSLVHDDIIDESKLRHGKATVNAREGTNTAILVGDFLFAKASELAASISSEAAELLANSFSKLCEGQASEMKDEFNTRRTLESYRATIAGKTAALFSASCRLGALIAKVSSADVEAYTEFGSNFGMAFQIIDDVLDFISTEKKIGKPVGNDVKEGVYTLPLLLALKISRPTYERLLKAGDISGLSAKLQADGFINQALDNANNYSNLAAKNVSSINKNLADFSGNYNLFFQ